jgi:YebC/PmpR family DNA-binding regulatory protein
MAGHSKWANIKHRKGKEDARRAKIFTKLIREITVSASLGGADPNSNPRLRAALYAAYAANMTKDTAERAMKRGAGGQEGRDVEEITYEGYGPAGVAIIVECMTNNRNRTVGEVRHAFTKCGGNLGTDGSVSYLFTRKGIISFTSTIDEEQLMDVALNAGAEDIISNDDGSIDVITAFESFLSVKESLEKVGFIPDAAQVTMISSTDCDITELAVAEKVMRLIDMLEDLDDVQKVYSNANISDEIMESLDA